MTGCLDGFHQGIPDHTQEVFDKIGFFRSIPMGSVIKGDGSFRIINDLSFPHKDPDTPSVNSFVNKNDYATTRPVRLGKGLSTNTDSPVPMEVSIPARPVKQIVARYTYTVWWSSWMRGFRKARRLIKDVDNTTSIQDIVWFSSEMGVASKDEKVHEFAEEQRYIGFIRKLL